MSGDWDRYCPGCGEHLSRCGCEAQGDYTSGMETCAKHREITRECVVKELEKLKHLFENQKNLQPADDFDYGWNHAMFHAAEWTAQEIKRMKDDEK